MTPLYQNDPWLRDEPSIATHGCLFRCLTEIAECRAGMVLQADQIIALYRWLKEQGHIWDREGYQSFILDHEATARAAQYYLQQQQTIRYVLRQTLMGDTVHDFDNGVRPNEYIGEWRLEGASINHFVRMFEDEQIRWDPLWPVRRKTALISIRGYVA